MVRVVPDEVVRAIVSDLTAAPAEPTKADRRIGTEIRPWLKRIAWPGPGGIANSPFKSVRLFDHLVGNGEHAGWNSQAKRLGGLHVDDQLEFGWLLDWKIGWLCALQNIFGSALYAVSSLQLKDYLLSG